MMGATLLGVTQIPTAVTVGLLMLLARVWGRPRRQRPKRTAEHGDVAEGEGVLVWRGGKAEGGGGGEGEGGGEGAVVDRQGASMEQAGHAIRRLVFSVVRGMLRCHAYGAGSHSTSRL
jgi:hypothetical protein